MGMLIVAKRMHWRRICDPAGQQRDLPTKERLRDEDEQRIHGAEPCRHYPSPFEPSEQAGDDDGG
jgi:hypothetical protein